MAEENAKSLSKKTLKKREKRGIDISWRPKFLELLARSLNVVLSANGAGVNRSTAYEQRRTDPAFAKQWDDAIQEAIERLEASAYERAKNVSDTLAIFLLKSHKPERYQERYRNTNVTIEIDLSQLTDAQLDRFEQHILRCESPERAYALARQEGT